jgi:hypothetical protein
LTSSPEPTAVIATCNCAGQGPTSTVFAPSDELLELSRLCWSRDGRQPRCHSDVQPPRFPSRSSMFPRRRLGPRQGSGRSRRQPSRRHQLRGLERGEVALPTQTKSIGGSRRRASSTIHELLRWPDCSRFRCKQRPAFRMTTHRLASPGNVTAVRSPCRVAPQGSAAKDRLLFTAHARGFYGSFAGISYPDPSRRHGTWTFEAWSWALWVTSIFGAKCIRCLEVKLHPSCSRYQTRTRINRQLRHSN